MSLNKSLLTFLTEQAKKKPSKPKAPKQQVLDESNPYYVADSNIAGKGAFASQYIPKGSMVDMLHQINQPGVDYNFTELGKRYNHSETPNTVNKLIGNKRFMVAQEDIMPGQELTGDYRMQPDLEQPQPNWKMQQGGATAYADATRLGAVPRYGRSYQRPPQSYDGFLKGADIATDIMQLGHFIPTPITQGIAFAGDFFGAGIDGYQAIDAATKGNYGDAAINAASAFLPSFLKSKGYLRDMYNVTPGSTAAKIANLGSKDGSYRPLTALPKLVNNPAVKKGLTANRSVAGALGAEIWYDQRKDGGQTRDEREMVNGIADILTQVKDLDNREQIARQMMTDFERENVTYNPAKFKQMSQLQEGGETVYNDTDSTFNAYLNSIRNWKKLNNTDVNNVKNDMINYMKSPLYAQRQTNYPENYRGQADGYQKKKYETAIANAKVQQRINNVRNTPVQFAKTLELGNDYFDPLTNKLSLNPMGDQQSIAHEMTHASARSMTPGFNGIKYNRLDSDHVNGRYWDTITGKKKLGAFNTGLNEREIGEFVNLARPVENSSPRYNDRDEHEDKDADSVMFADESYGDLMGVRQLLHNKGYTKNFGDNIDQQLIDKALQDKAVSDDFLFKRMHNKYGSDKLIHLNNTIAANKNQQGVPMARYGGWLDKYQDGGTKYKVQSGQYLSQIAKANNVSVDDLVMANKITNPNLIKPGQELFIPEGANDFRMPSKDGYVGFDQLMERQKQLSSLPSRDMIREYRRQNQMSGNYAVVDKASGNMNIYNPTGEQVSSFPVGVGKDFGDKRTINVKGPNRRNTTPAGIYTLTNKGTGRDSYAPKYGNNIWELVDQNNMQQPTALHQVPTDLPYRNSIIGDKNPNNNRISNGCINCRKKDFDTEVERYMGKGNQIYVLPDDPNNKFVVKNNKIMLTGDKFDKDVSYSKRDLTAKPIQIKWSPSQFVSKYPGRKELMLKESGPVVKQMAQSIVSNKQKLMKDLNIDNDTFNQISQLSLGVAGQESDYGLHPLYRYKESKEGQGDVIMAKRLKNIWNLKNPFNISPSSRGYTQVKYNSQNKDVRNLFAKYGINSPDDLGDPSKSNIATIIMMGYMHNNELPQLKAQMDKIGVSKMDALLYLNQGKRGEITKGTATPNKNNYIQNVKKYSKRFVLNQKQQYGGSQNNWLENYN